MVTVIFKLILGLYLVAHSVSSAEKSINGSSTTTTTTTTTTTAVPVDMSGQATDRFETSVQLDPGESRSRAKSHRYSTRGRYVQRGPTYEKNEYEDRAVEYEKDTRPHEDFYKGSEETNYHQHHQQEHRQQHNPEDYADSYEPHYEQQHHHRNHDHSYEERDEKRPKYSFPDHSGNAPSPYGHQEYSKEESYDSKEEEGYQGGKPPYMQYAYEVSKKKQQATYDPLDVPDNDGKSGYGPGETKVYPPKGLQHQEYYTRPKPTRYVSTSPYKDEEYRSARQKEEKYYPTVPKEAGYAPEEPKEPRYLQVHPKEPSYPQQAGYLPKYQDVAEILKLLQQEGNVELPDGGKLGVLFKNLGHKSGDHSSNKERHGYLLLPIVQDKIEEKLRELKEKHLGGEHKQDDKEHSYRQRPVQEKETHYVSHPKAPVVKYQADPKVVIPYGEHYSPQKIPIVKYPAEPKVTYGADYVQDHEDEKLRGKTVAAHPSYGLFRPIIGHSKYIRPEYESHKAMHAQPYTDGDASEEGSDPYIPKEIEDYEDEKDIKTYPGAPLMPVYGGTQGVIPSFTSPVKYEPASLYEKAPEYIPQYDMPTSHKSLPIKIRGYRPSIYSTLPHIVDYTRISDYPPHPSKAKKNSATSHLYGTHYRNVGARLAAGYLRPRLEAVPRKPKSIAIVLQKPRDHEPVILRSPYSTKGRISTKTLVRDIGLHDYESLLSKPKNGGTSVGSLYYDLHSYPVEHGYAPLSYQKSASKYYS